MEKAGHINKDLILRERLALERTVMANDRTLLSFIRTALYFAVAGLSLNELITLRSGEIIKLVLFACSGILLAAGVFKYIQQLRKIRDSRKHIGNYLLELEDA